MVLPVAALPRLLAALLLAAGGGVFARPVPAVAQEQTHVGEYARGDIVAGAEIYTAQCAVCHGLAGNTTAGVDLRANRFRSVVSDDDLRRVIRTGLPAAGMPPLTLSDEATTALVAFIRAGMDPDGSAMSLTIGDAVRGREIVHGKAGCLACHRVHDRGGRSAPDLSHVASSRSPASIHLSLIDPTRAMLPINRPIRAITRDGRTIAGRRLNEDTYTLLIADEDGRLQALLKEDLREYEVLTTSPMPSYGDTLSQAEIADVFGYLLTLKDTDAVSGR